jgi:hypothetical protein
MDPKTERDEGEWLQDTNERIHSSVRIRLACQGLSLNDETVWKCEALRHWQLKLSDDTSAHSVPQHPQWFPDADINANEAEAGPLKNGKGSQIMTNGAIGKKRRWVWEYTGPQNQAPPDPKQRVMVEEHLGPYERYVLKITGGSPNVYEFADKKVDPK